MLTPLLPGKGWEVWWKEYWLWNQEAEITVFTLPFTECVTLGKSLHFFKHPFASLWGWLYVHVTCAVTQDPGALPGSMLCHCQLEILINFEQGPMFPLCIDPTRYVDSPVYQSNEDNNT